MIDLKQNRFLVESASELPDFTNAKDLYVDFETTSFDPAEAAYSPHKGHRICGVAVTADDCPQAYYVPVRHHFKDGTYQPGNVDLEQTQRWLKDVIGTSKQWVNTNVKFDAHFAHYEGAEFNGGLLDLTTSAKVLDSDMTYKGGYGLKNLSKRWLDEDITDVQDGVKGYLAEVRLHRNKKANDYGVVPIDIMAPYAAQDVLSARRLHHHIRDNMPEQCQRVWQTETLLTPVLYDMEVEGMRVDRGQLEQAEVQILSELIGIEEQIFKLVGMNINPSNSAHCLELLCNYWGLPVLAYNDNNNPSFDKDALTQYTLHPEVKRDPLKLAVIKLVQYYRKRHTLLTFFVRPYQQHEVNGIMHPSYNQAVRTGRMSCKRPNAQQLNKEAKSFILPREGEAFLSCDYSQIEFRLIVHYVKAIDAINAYTQDPDTDFHTWVAEMCKIPRRPAKNVNFAIGFGAGRGKVVSMLSSNLELMDPEITKDMTADQFDVYCRRRGEQVFDQYNAALAGLRPTSRAASRNARSRGYVFNGYGRRCHLPEAFSHIAFNRIIQSFAADIMKERTVALAPRYNSVTRELGVRLQSSVHDETLMTGQREAMRNPRVVSHCVQVLEDVQPNVKLSVPIRTGAGWSDKNWAVASSDEAALNRKENWVCAA